jgi:hypothetical protein
MQTLRRELRQVIKEVLKEQAVNISMWIDYKDPESETVYDHLLDVVSDKIADAVLEVKGIAKVNPGVEWMVLGGVSTEEIAKIQQEEIVSKEKTDEYERTMGYNPLSWGKMERLRKFISSKPLEEIRKFAIWSRKDFSQLSPSKALQFPDLVIELWPQACPKVVERPIQKPVEKEDETKYVKLDYEKYKKEHGI